MLVVSDTSPISNLILIGLSDLLPQIFKTIIVPEAVYQELMANGKQHYVTQTVQELQWIVVRKVRDLSAVERLQEEFLIDLGEAQAIILASELKAERLLVDERLGRIVAKQQGYKVTGLLGVLLIAKEQSLITDLKPWVDKLINQANFRIHSSLYEEILVLAGEADKNKQ